MSHEASNAVSMIPNNKSDAEAALGENLSGIPATLLITVWGRARDSLGPNPLIDDPFAVQFYREHPEWFVGLDALGGWLKKSGTLGIAIRTRCFDEHVERFQKDHPDGMVLNIGCGLDARSHRLDNGRATWVEVDVPESQAWRRRMLPTDERHHVVDGSVLEPDAWLSELPRQAGQAVLVISEGTLMYFDEDVVQRFIAALVNRLGAFYGYIEFMGDLGVGKVHPLVRAVGVDAPFRFGARDPSRTLESFHPSLRVTDQDGLFRHERHRWGPLRWLTAMFPSLHTRLGSVLLAFEVEADETPQSSK